jgi:hypothetical protein
MIRARPRKQRLTTSRFVRAPSSISHESVMFAGGGVGPFGGGDFVEVWAAQADIEAAAGCAGNIATSQ